MRRHVLSTIISVCLLVTGHVWADLTLQQADAVRALIAKFSAREFAVRQKAVDDLVKMGPDVVPLVQKALEETTDNEVRLRLGMVLKGIDEKHGPGVSARLAAMRRFGYDAAKISLDETDATLKEVAALLADRSGNTPVIVRGGLETRAVTVAGTDLTYWQALDLVCEKADLAYDADWSSAAMRLNKATGTRAVTTYTGPAVISVTRVQRTRTQTLDPRWPEPLRDSRVLSITTRFLFEDRLPLVRSNAVFTRVLGADRKEMKPSPAGGNYNNWGRDPYSRTAALTFTGEQAAATGPLVINGTLTLEFGEAPKTLRFENIFAPGERNAADGKTAITLVEAKRTGTNVLLQLRTRTDDAAHLAFFTMSTTDFGFALIDPSGRRHFTVTSARMGRDKDPEGATDLNLTIGTVPVLEGNWSLLFRYPALVVKRDYPFTLTDVKLP